jgi:hypothetical protein
MKASLQILYFTTLPAKMSYLIDSLGSPILYSIKQTTVPGKELVKRKKLRYLALERNQIAAVDIIHLKFIFSTSPRIFCYLLTFMSR